MNEAKGEKSTQNICYSVNYTEIVASPGCTELRDGQPCLERQQTFRRSFQGGSWEDMHTMCETSCHLGGLEVLPSDRDWAQVNKLGGGSLCGASAVWAGRLEGHSGPCPRLCLNCRSCQSLGKLLTMLLKACKLPSERPGMSPLPVSSQLKFASFIQGTAFL